MNTKFVFFFIAISLHVYAKETTKWGMLNYSDTVIIDETEITVGEWMEYCTYSDVTLQKLYVGHQTKEEKDLLLNILQKYSFPKNLRPTVFENSIIEQIFENEGKRTIYEVAGLRGYIYIGVPEMLASIDSINKNIKKYLSLPITGISFSQVNEFCRWRTFTDSLSASINLKDNYYSFALPDKEVIFQLPELDSVSSKKDFAHFNYFNAKTDYKRSRLFEYANVGLGLTSVFSFDDFKCKNGMKLYGILGNFSEMTSQNGVAYGGSFYHFAVNAHKEILYVNEEKWLGFRCVAVQKKFK